MFDTLHSRYSSESNVWPVCGVVLKVHEDRVWCCCVVLRRGTAWVWEYGYLGTGYLLSKTSSTMH